MNTSIKYPRSHHLPFSLGLQNDDRRMEDETCFDGKTLVITVKMDGENTSMYRDGIHARSLDSSHHPSRSVVKSLHATIKNDIPKGWRICGENMYAKHSIHYTDLESYFYAFSVWNDKNEALSWNDTIRFCNGLGLTVVPVYGLISYFNKEKHINDKISDWQLLEEAYRKVLTQGHEGIVVRNVESFHYNDFQENLAKAVRPNHVQSSIHWSKEWIPNLLKST